MNYYAKIPLNGFIVNEVNFWALSFQEHTNYSVLQKLAGSIILSTTVWNLHVSFNRLGNFKRKPGASSKKMAERSRQLRYRLIFI